MKKTVRTTIIATIITIVIIMSCAYAMPAQAARPEFYPKLTIVVSCTVIDSELYIIDCVDREGYKWSFFDYENTWREGDIANLLMWALNEQEEEDEIIEVYWEGHNDNPDTFFQTIEWH